MYIVIIVALLFLVFNLIFKSVRRKRTHDNIDLLKNALLSFALKHVCYKDVSNFDMNYAKYNGTKLPMFSGYSLTNACFSYIVDSKTLTFNNVQMDHKLDAINKYLVHNLSTEKQVEKLFEDFVSHYDLVS
jgi:hypothetical protein